MHLQIAILTFAFATTTAFPLNHEASREAPWSLQRDNQATDKKTFAKDSNGIWKNHVVSSDLYSQDSYNPIATELRQKLSMESERLRARLKQELAELRERLSPYPSHPKHTLANVRDFLAPFTKQLQTALQSNTQELCERLSLNLQDLNPDETMLYQEAAQKITQALDESHQKRTAAFEEFKIKAFEAVEEEKDSSGKEFWEEVTARLGQEVCTFSLEVQGKVAALKIVLAGHLALTQPSRDEMASKVDQFCQNSSVQNQQFISNLDQQIITLQENQNNNDSSSFHQTNIESIQEDFSTRLTALLQDIVHTLS
ncbi:apolipoprotein A-IV-like isoform X2 [Myxocyprinus asiaticus]|uniref:apolipoprotein A-IV-like isoform X2 n=1 Tax=Myxocyprinus asiaticus TaxID=70543 RepID=UPI0022228C59|nr:apolipoprotein A-IV-like isoform X2 [Myxocyprinus asiaticus]